MLERQLCDGFTAYFSDKGKAMFYRNIIINDDIAGVWTPQDEADAIKLTWRVWDNEADKIRMSGRRR